MKTLKKLMCAILLPLGALAVSCTESDNWEPGAPEAAGCYEVFFPEQENTGDLEIAPETQLEFTYTALRNNVDGAITVPVVISRNTNDLYSVSPIEFADGEDETTFTVKLSEQAELSTKYDFEIDIVDPLYVSQYTADKSSSLKLSITRVKWTEENAGSFISAFFEISTDCKLYRKDDSSYFKITNFLGLGADLFFTWDEESNLCEIDGLVYTGYEYTHEDNQRYPVYIMDAIGYYNVWKGNNYDWAFLEQNGIPQPYYDPNKKAFFFHVYLGVPALGGGFGWTDEVFLLEGGSLGCELSLQLLPVSQMFKPEFAAQYPDDSHLGYMIKGANLTELKYALLPTEVYDDAEAQLGITLDAYLDKYGVDASEKDEDGFSIFDVMAQYGYYADIAGNLDPNTSYTLFAKATNAGGDSAFEYVSCKTASPAVEIDPSAAVQGYYTMTCSPAEGVVFTNTFSVIPREEANEFFVKGIGYDGFTNEWYATYDETASTLTMNGVEKGYEDDGNYFAMIYGYANQERTQVYAFFSFASDESEGDDPCVFTVDPATKKLSKLNTDFILPVFDYSTGQAGNILGYLGYYAAGTEIKVVDAAASAAGVRSANIPFSSVRNIVIPETAVKAPSADKMLRRSNACGVVANRVGAGKIAYKSIKSSGKGTKLTNAVSKL